MTNNSFFFNPNEFRYALDKLTDNPWLAVEKFKRYFEKYPKDYSAYGYYITALICIKELDEAEEVLNNLINMISLDKKYQREDKYKEFYKKNLFFCQLKLYLYQERFQEAYNLYVGYSNLHFENSEFIPILCRKKLNILTKNDLLLTPYLYRQVVRYSDEEFQKHVKRHTYENNIDLENKNGAIFSSTFPLSKVLETLPNYLSCNQDNCIYSGYYNDVYYFKFENCGKVVDKTVNFFKVVAIHNSQDIITMYPCEETSIPYIDLSYLMEDDKEKVKKISQIEKFNRRYQRKGN